MNLPMYAYEPVVDAVGFYICAGVFVRVLRIKKGEGVEQHAHPYDHVSMLIAGRVLVRVEGEPDAEYIGHHVLKIAAHKQHQIIGLDDSLWYCIHRIPEEFDGDDEGFMRQADKVLVTA